MHPFKTLWAQVYVRYAHNSSKDKPNRVRGTVAPTMQFHRLMSPIWQANMSFVANVYFRRHKFNFVDLSSEWIEFRRQMYASCDKQLCRRVVLPIWSIGLVKYEKKCCPLTHFALLEKVQIVLVGQGTYLPYFRVGLSTSMSALINCERAKSWATRDYLPTTTNSIGKVEAGVLKLNSGPEPPHL